ncbi:hypothetical protein G7046_g706 [Stylonectria norvegica]|nr:hypothetical protein G7046_g706 [Stylonectria norvegica]
MYPTVVALAVAALAVDSALAAHTLKKTYDHSNFLDSFDFRDKAYYDQLNPDYGGDPTGGSVNYLSKASAVSSGIVNTNNNQVYLGVDFTKQAKLLPNGLHGRDSVRLESKDTWSSGLLIADIAHMPGTACGVWPSLWTYNFAENPVGEVDIIEGINMQTANDVSLHTCGTCSFTKIGGLNQRTNCNNGGTVSNQCEDGQDFDGCGNTMSANSYGNGFNAAGGGVYAVSLASDALKIYWWPRSKIPSDITSGAPDPTKWGTPASLFTSGSNCNVANYFKGMNIIINTDFCGANIPQEIWDQECKSITDTPTCDEFVATSPAAFDDSYWLFNSIKIYS